MNMPVTSTGLAADAAAAATAAVSAAAADSPAAAATAAPTAAISIHPPLSDFDAALLEYASGDPVPPLHAWPQRLQPSWIGAGAGATSAAAAAATALPPSSYSQPVWRGTAAAGSAEVTPSSLPLPPHLNYDSMLGHATHLYRSAQQMERMLRRRAQRQTRPLSNTRDQQAATAGATAQPCEVRFIDPFGTPMQIPVQAWQTVADAVQHLQSYIPQHVRVNHAHIRVLKGWCEIGVLRPDVPATASIDLTDDGTASASANATSSTSQSQAARVRPLSISTLHMTLAHAQLVASPDDAFAMVSTSSRPSANSDGATPFTLVAFGHLTVLLRFASSTASSPAAASGGTSRMGPARVHTLSLQVFGLDLLSDVLARVVAHAATHLRLRVRRADLYAVRRSFTLPLHALSATDCGGAADALRLNEQQSVFSAQLVGSGDAERILIVEALETEGDNARGSSMHLSVRTLSGQQIDVAARPDDTVASLKRAMAARGASGAAQQQLIFQQTILTDDARTLASYGIGSGSTLQLLLLLKSHNESEGFLLQCGRPGLNPLSTSSRACAESVGALMAWSLPPASKLRAMATPLLSSLLLHTRRLASEVHSAVRDRTLLGHSSRGRVWIDEVALRAQCQQADDDERIPIDDDDEENRVNVSDAPIGFASPGLKRSVSLLSDDDDEDGGMKLKRAVQTIASTSVVDLTVGDTPLQIDSDDVQWIGSHSGAPRSRVATQASVPTALPVPLASITVTSSASQRRQPSPSHSSACDTPPPLE